MSSSITWSIGIRSMAATVSVPFGDHVFLNPPCMGDRENVKGVSVPFGDHVFLNEVLAMAEGAQTTTFPSPSGIMSSSMVLEKLRKAKGNTEVSVPFGDHVFLNKSLSKPKVISALLFPSPSGIMSSSIQGSRGGTACCIPVSVPFGDHVFLNDAGSLPRRRFCVSVPFGDHVFLNAACREQCAAQASFRPLRGSCLPQLFPVFFL